MSGEARQRQQRYAAAIQGLMQVANAADLDDACTAIIKEHSNVKAELLAAAMGLTTATDKLGLTDFSKFQSLGPALVKSHCAACSRVLSLLQAAMASNSPSSPSVRQGFKTAVAALHRLSDLLRAWNKVLPGTPDTPATVPFDQRENSNALPAVCQTDLLPQLGRTAALLAPLVQAGTIPGPADSEADLLLEALSTGVLGLWVAIVTADNMEEGFSICEPRCLDVLPPICALTRAVLCRLPDISALSKDVGGVFSLASRGVANYLCGHLHMQYCKAFGAKAAPERGCSKATAHMLARSEDVQWLLIAHLGMKLAATHKQTKGGTECQSASSTLAIPGLPTTISAEAFRKSLLAGLAKDGHADVVKDLAAAFPTGEPDEDGPFFSRNKKLPPLHEKLMAALGMRGLATNGLLAKVTEQFPEDRGIARLALWTVEHQFLQVGVPEPGIVGIPCGAHGPLLAALAEYLVTVGPESVQFHACLPVARRVAQDYADKQAAGKLPPAIPVAAAAAAAPKARSSSSGTSGASAAEQQQQQPLDQSMVHGLGAVLAVAVPACVLNARRKNMSMMADMLEPSLLPVKQMSQAQWAAWLQEQLWGIINTLLATEGGDELLVAAVWQQPATAAASLEWLVRFGPAPSPPPQQDAAATIRLARRLAAVCAAPPSAAAAAKADVSMACLLVSLLKRLKLLTQQPGSSAPPAAFRAMADIAQAAAALGAAVASGTNSGKQGTSRSSPGKGSSSKSKPADSSSGDRGSVKKGPALCAVVAAHCLWWLGSQLPEALTAAGSVTLLEAASNSSGWVLDAPDQLLGTFKGISEVVSWLAAVLPSLAGSVCVADSAAWSQQQQALQQQLSTEGVAAVQDAVAGLREAVADESGKQWHAFQEPVRDACAVLVSLGAGVTDLLPCGMCCNRPGCCQLSAESERRSVDSEKGVLLRCSGCRLAHFCCKSCHKLAWPQHKAACKLMAG